MEQEIYEALTLAADVVCELKCPSVWKAGEKQPHSDECRRVRSARSAWMDYCSTQDLVASGGLFPTKPHEAEVDWKAEAIRRFGPVPPGAGENARLIAGYHYAFVEGAKSALSVTSQNRAPQGE